MKARMISLALILGVLASGFCSERTYAQGNRQRRGHDARVEALVSTASGCLVPLAIAFSLFVGVPILYLEHVKEQKRQADIVDQANDLLGADNSDLKRILSVIRIDENRSEANLELAFRELHEVLKAKPLSDGDIIAVSMVLRDRMTKEFNYVRELDLPKDQRKRGLVITTLPNREGSIAHTLLALRCVRELLQRDNFPQASKAVVLRVATEVLVLDQDKHLRTVVEKGHDPEVILTALELLTEVATGLDATVRAELLAKVFEFKEKLPLYQSLSSRAEDLSKATQVLIDLLKSGPR